MEKIKLLNFIQALFPMSPQKAEAIAEKFTYQELTKDNYLIKEGKVNLVSYFLEEGYVRSYTLNTEGVEVTTAIFAAPTFANDFYSFFKRQPAKENFQALTDLKMWAITYEDLQYCFHNIPEFREFGRMMLITNFAAMKDRVLGMIQMTAEQRYRHLLATQPAVFQHVPLKMIASYLGITDTSLSRIRKEIAKHA